MNEQKFSGKADNYDKYRPSYPDELLQWLTERAGKRTVDIGAGTGKFTACLVRHGFDVTAVEPNTDMLEKLHKNHPDISAVQASAEDTGLPAHSFQLVTAAQAFHWFDKQRFRDECQRLLTDDGRLAVVWNERSKDGFEAERDSICMKYCGAFHSGHVFTGYDRSDGDGDSFLRNEYFAVVEYFSQDYFVPMSREAYIGDILSRSYALSEGDEHYAAFISELNGVFDRYQRGGFVTAKYKSTCYLGKF